MITINLQGKIALVTGGNNGIGLAISETLAKAGAKVAINYLKDSDAASRAVETIRSAGGEAAAFQADVTDLAQIDRLLGEVREKFGRVDILVNNAGHMIKRLPNMEMEEDHYEKVMDVNFKSCVFVSKATASDMIEAGGGVIVNVASLAAHNGGGPGSSVYAASKGAMVSYSKGFAKEVAKHGIRVNCVSPGFIGQTAFHATFTTDAARQSTVSTIPLGREGVPQDVADSVLFFASDLSAYLTGENIEINGGMFMK
jgi:3-oxoacyl-[acyl-carrier protein] reductase